MLKFHIAVFFSTVFGLCKYNTFLFTIFIQEIYNSAIVLSMLIESSVVVSLVLLAPEEL